MAGPPSSAFINIGWSFAGGGLPLGAFTSLGGNVGITPGDDVLDIVEASTVTLMDTICASAVACSSISIKVGPDATGPTYTRAVAISGGIADGGVNPNTAFLIRKTAAGLSQRFAGRMFWPGPPENGIQANGYLDPTFLGTVDDAVTLFWTELNTANAIDGVVVFNGSSDPTTVTGLDIQPQTATQRRRLRR